MRVCIVSLASIVIAYVGDGNFHT